MWLDTEVAAITADLRRLERERDERQRREARTWWADELRRQRNERRHAIVRELEDDFAEALREYDRRKSEDEINRLLDDRQRARDCNQELA